MFIVFSLLFCTAIHAHEIEGMVYKKSANSVEKTLDRMETILKEKGVAIIARVEHSQSAKKLNIELRPTALLIFGNPQLGSHFFTSHQSAGIDLPLKVLAWQDEKGQVWIAYNDPQYIAKRHGIADREEIVKKMTGALDKFTEFAIKP